MTAWLKEYTLNVEKEYSIAQCGFRNFLFNRHWLLKKPHLGILTTCNGRKYVIPLTSAKRKHASWRDVTTTNYRVYEEIDTRATIVDKYDIIVDETDLNKLRQKGIPEDEQRRNLMVKEYFFCKKYKKQIEAKAKKIYEKQMVTGVVAPYHCNYKVLESVADTYK